jgi:NADH dehydrogenase FAD-containing subunit
MSTTIPTLEQHPVTEPPSIKFAVGKDKQRSPPDTHIPGLDLEMGLTYPSQSLRFLKPLQSKNQLDPQTVTQARVPLRVVIVGAGLGGLATSIALARRGHSVLVLEQAHQLGEV